MYLNFHSSIKNPGLLFLLSLFSCAIMMNYGVRWMNPLVSSVIALMVIFLLINFNRWWPIIIVCALNLIITLPKFPRQANHSNIELIMCLIGGGILIYKLISKTKLNLDTVTITIRYSLVAIYFWAGFHKINSGFFSIDGSCGPVIMQNFNEFFFGNDFKPSYLFSRTIQIATIVLEVFLPFGILFHKTRKATAILLVAFHFLLSFCNFANFSAFAAFLIVGSILDLNDNILAKSKLIKALKIYLVFSATSVITCFILRKIIPISDAELLVLNGIIYNIGWLYFFTQFFRLKLDAPKSYKFSLLPILVAMLISIWAFQCYLGLSTRGNLSMFSNLITEKSRNNHYLINTNYTKICNIEEDYITLLDISVLNKSKEFSKMIGYDIPLSEFQYITREWLEGNNKNKFEKIGCRLIHNGREINIENLATSKYSNPHWWSKFIYFRGIPSKNHNVCQW